MNRAHEQRGEDWSARLIHVSGFTNALDPAIQDMVMPADIVHFQRNLVHEQVLDAIRYWQGLGKIFTADLDDAYNRLPFSNPAFQFWQVNSSQLDPPPLVMLEKGLRLIGNLTAPNRYLLNDWAHACRGYYIPNYARSEWWVDDYDAMEARRARGIDDKIIIGWGGSVSHYDSWWGSGIREAATRICARHANVSWMICGNDPRIYEQLPVPRDQKIAQPGVQPNDWPKIVRQFDIGVAPLFGPYDQRRSWIKGMEYQLAGIPWIGTRGEPYREMADSGILVDNGPEAWEDALETVISQLHSRRTIASDRLELARQHYLIDNNLDMYARTYRQIIDDTESSGARLPGVFHIDAREPATVPAAGEETVKEAVA